MRFGLVVTDERHGDAAITLLEAAQARGWSCRCFLNDRGVLLLADSYFIGSPAFRLTAVAVCEVSMERYEEEGLRPSDINSHVVIGSQYQNAELVKTSDRILVL